MSPCVCTTALLAFVLAASFIVQPAASQTSETNNDALPVNYPAKILPRSDTICPSTEEQETTFAEIDQEISTLIRSTVLTTLECPGVNAQYPASSCLEIAECDPIVSPRATTRSMPPPSPSRSTATWTGRPAVAAVPVDGHEWPT